MKKDMQEIEDDVAQILEPKQNLRQRLSGEEANNQGSFRMLSPKFGGGSNEE